MGNLDIKVSILILIKTNPMIFVKADDPLIHGIHYAVTLSTPGSV